MYPSSRTALQTLFSGSLSVCYNLFKCDKMISNIHISGGYCMKVLVLNGSPRINGNTSIAIAEMEQIFKEEGIETTGVISSVTDAGQPDEIDIRVQVRYRTEDGEEIEGILINAPDDLAPGQKVRIKYHPRYKMNARLIEIL